jgi:manganese transport protein
MATGLEFNSGLQKYAECLKHFGPAFYIAVGYIDPGNWATDIEAGSRFGYSLVWVVLLSNLIALLLQGLALRLGLATGLSFPP